MPFFFTRKSLFLKNKRLLLFYADSYIDELEKDAPGMSCKEDLMKAIAREIDRSESEIATYSEKCDNIKQIAKNLVADIGFDLVDLGKYHLHGHFNSLGPGRNLVYILKKALKEFLDAGELTQEEYDDNLSALRDAIRQVL